MEWVAARVSSCVRYRCIHVAVCMLGLVEKYAWDKAANVLSSCHLHSYGLLFEAI